MWSNNTGDATIQEDQVEVFKISNGHENIDPNTDVFCHHIVKSLHRKRDVIDPVRLRQGSQEKPK